MDLENHERVPGPVRAPGGEPAGAGRRGWRDDRDDISWSAPGETVNLRVAAVIIRDRKVLLCTVDRLEYWFLPGGRIRFGEPAQLALSRELAEELGHQFPAGRLALVVETSIVTAPSSTKLASTTASPGPPRCPATI